MLRWSVQSDPPEKRCSPRIGAEIIEIWLSFKINDAFSALLISLFHPLKGMVTVIYPGIYYGKCSRLSPVFLGSSTFFEFQNTFKNFRSEYFAISLFIRA